MKDSFLFSLPKVTMINTLIAYQPGVRLMTKINATNPVHLKPIMTIPEAARRIEELSDAIGIMRRSCGESDPMLQILINSKLAEIDDMEEHIANGIQADHNDWMKQLRARASGKRRAHS